MGLILSYEPLKAEASKASGKRVSQRDSKHEKDMT